MSEPAPGYSMTPAEAQAARTAELEGRIIPALQRKIFEPYANIRVALLCVGQFWCDEADDAVHDHVLFSERDDPHFADESHWLSGDAIPGEVHERSGYRDSLDSLWQLGAGWDSNCDAIPLWAAFSPEGGNQEYDEIREVFAPAVTVFRDGSYEFHDMLRPWLDGIQAEWDREYGND